VPPNASDLQGSVRDRDKRERERQQLADLVGRNLTYISQLDGLDFDTYASQVRVGITVVPVDVLQPGWAGEFFQHIFAVLFTAQGVVVAHSSILPRKNAQPAGHRDIRRDIRETKVVDYMGLPWSGGPAGRHLRKGKGGASEFPRPACAFERTNASHFRAW
jgi:hypothetical protein